MTASSGVVLSNLAYLIGAVVLAFIGGLVVWLFHRQPKSVDANVESFQRGLQAIAPDSSRSVALRDPAVTQQQGLRLRPRSSVTLLDPKGEPAATDDLMAGHDRSSRVANHPAAPVEAEGHHPESLVAAQAEQNREGQSGAGDGAGNRAGAETG
jgi:hypothetical protein